MPRCSPATRFDDAIRVSAKDSDSCAEILKAKKAKVKPQNLGAEVLSIRRTRKEEILLVLKKGGDVSSFEKALDQAVGQRAGVKSLVSKRSVEVRDLDETIKRDLGDQCRLYKRFGGVQTGVVCLTDTDNATQCIEFSIQERSHPVNSGRGGKGRSPSWNTRRLSKEKLQKHP